MNIVAEIEKENMKEKVPQFKVGDLVDVHVKTVEGEKERIQIFNGTVISKKGSGNRVTFTVRRVVQGEGVERVFPLHSPNIVDIVVKKSHKIRRAKLYYLRDRKGKSARLKEIRRRVKKTSAAENTVPVVVADEPAKTEEAPAETTKAEKAPKAKAKNKDE
ncbi:50S ribosomal protein L19 [Candidatus Scalindua japonica]|uniref:Large ribosomal subunit protein bL19 n=1 Tax=Candidatus Scalindua japonica TaxID=1284222 RepID=A0A286TVM5_9BACT|nr:50S ribosomal protein L19 [Candidatus Scalindua japonica]